MIAALVVMAAWALVATVAAWIERNKRLAAEHSALLNGSRAAAARNEASRWEREAEQLASMHAPRPHVTSQSVVWPRRGGR